MKKVIAGIGFMLVGTIMYLSASLITSFNMQYTTEWITSIGKYWQTMLDMGMMPVVVIGVLLLISGILLTLQGVFSKKDN